MIFEVAACLEEMFIHR